MSNYSLDPDWAGWLEIVIGVADVGAAAAPLEQAAGWSLAHHDRVGPDQLGALGLDASQGGEERVIHVAETYGGLLRFMSFSGEAQRIRPDDAKPWDAGGIWLINARTRDIEAQSQRMIEAGYGTEAGVHEFDFEFLQVREVIHQGPDGMLLSMIEQLAPPIDPPEPYQLASRGFNAAVVCRDHEASRHFYVDQLGFVPWIETTWDKNNEGLNLVAPRGSFDEMEKMNVSIVSPGGDNFGSIELLSYEGDLEIATHAERAKPPALGTLMFRFYTPDLATRLKQFDSAGLPLINDVNEYFLPPYGPVRSATVRSPEGVWHEFFELVG